MPPNDREFEAINKRVVTIEKALEALPAIDKRVKVIEDFGQRLNQVSIGIDAVSRKLTSIDETLGSIPAIEKRIKNVEDEMSKAKPETKEDRDILQRENLELKRVLAVEQLKVQSLTNDFAKLQDEHKKALDQIDFFTKGLQSIKFDALTVQFKDAIKTFNQQIVADKSQPYFIDSLDIELKTGLQYGNELKLMQAVPDKASPGNLSTIKFSLKPKTNLKITD